MASVAQRLMEHARARSGAITRAEALAIGASSTTIKRWVHEGRLVRVGTGLYVLPGVLTSERSTLAAATAALSAVVSHESAARLHQFDGLDPQRLAITVPVRRSNRFAGVTVHQSTDLAPDETIEIYGLPVTDAPRTLIDLAAVLPERLLATVLDQAVRMRSATFEEVSDRLEATARKGKPGVVKLRRLLAVRLGTNHVSDSTLETRLLWVIEQANLPLPVTQYRPPWLRKVNGRVDLAYIDEQILVEGDSQRWHGTPESFQLDRERDNLAQLAGWIVLRFTWHDITQRPSYVTQTIHGALMKRSRAHIRALQH